MRVPLCPKIQFPSVCRVLFLCILSAFSLQLAAQSPGGISTNLGLWLKANDNGGVTTDGATVLSWTDKSGNLSNLTGENAPAFTVNAINFNPAILLSGSDNFHINTPSIPAQYSTMYIIAKPVVNRAAANQLWNTNTYNDPAADHDVLFYVTGGLISYKDDVSGNTPGTSLTWNGDEVSLFRMEISNSPNYNVTYTKLGGIGETITTVNTTINSPNNFYTTLGNQSDIAGSEAFGYIAETLIYTTAAQTATDKNKIESYLALKYGITLDQTTPQNYVTSNATVVWNATTNAGYSSNILGIVRDDASALDQRVSASVNTTGVIAFANGATFSETQTDDAALTDLNALILGDNNGGTIFSTALSTFAAGQFRMSRVWKVQETGTTGTGTIRILKSWFTGSNPKLVRSTDNVLDATDELLDPTSNDADYYYFNIDFASGDYFSFVQQSVLPTNVPGGVHDGLSLWLKADDNGGVNTDGSQIGSWSDKSGIHSDFSSFSLDGGPTYAANAINYNPAILIQGASGNDKFFANNPSLDAQGTTMYVVGKAGVGGDNGYNQLWTTNTYAPFGNPHDILFYIQPTNRVGYFDDDGAGGGVSNRTNLTWAPDEVALFRTEISDATNYDISYSKAGSSIQTINGANNNGNLPNNAYSILGNWGNEDLTEPFGYVAETFVYKSSTQSPGEKQRIESYLALKYGITLDNTSGARNAGNYILSDGATTAWDASVNTDYHNRVIGIVRDDASSLYQKQSTAPDDSLQLYMSNIAASNPENTSTITNDLSAIVIGQTNDAYRAGTPAAAMPAGIEARFQRKFKITNTNFADQYSIRFKWDSTGPFDIANIRLLVDDDGDFSNAAVYGAPDVTITTGSIIVSGINTAIIPMNESRFITIGSVNKLLTSLPVKLVSFTAVPNNCNVALSWKSATEINFNRYEVQYSSDGNSFVTVGIVGGRGDNSSYSFIYQPADARASYRLRMADNDGKVTFSDVLLVNTGCKTEVKPSLYPNPVATAVTLSGLGSGAKKILIYASDGKEVYSAATSNTQMVVDAHKWAMGIYHVHIVFDNGKLVTQKFVKK